MKELTRWGLRYMCGMSLRLHVHDWRVLDTMVHVRPGQILHALQADLPLLSLETLIGAIGEGDGRMCTVGA